MDPIKILEQQLEFDFTIQFYSVPTDVEISKNCNAFFVVNLSGVGGTIVTVNNYPLNPALVAGSAGEVFVMGGNRGETVARRQLNIGMATGVGLVAVIQKYYTNLNC
jgi:hypothetical protein